MNRVVFVSLATGGLVFLLLSGLSHVVGRPVLWFGVAAGVLVSLGLFVGLLLAERRPTGSSGLARALFTLLGLLMGALGLWALFHPAPGQVAYVPWVALAGAAAYLAAAAYLWLGTS